MGNWPIGLESLIGEMDLVPEAAKTLLHYGFNELHLNKIFAAAFTNNPGSWRIMEKIGMKHEGTFKQHVVKSGEPMDITYYGILLDEYK